MFPGPAQDDWRCNECNSGTHSISLFYRIKQPLQSQFHNQTSNNWTQLWYFHLKSLYYVHNHQVLHVLCLVKILLPNWHLKTSYQVKADDRITSTLLRFQVAGEELCHGQGWKFWYLWLSCHFHHGAQFLDLLILCSNVFILTVCFMNKFKMDLNEKSKIICL